MEEGVQRHYWVGDDLVVRCRVKSLQRGEARVVQVVLEEEPLPGFGQLLRRHARHVFAMVRMELRMQETHTRVRLQGYRAGFDNGFVRRAPELFRLGPEVRAKRPAQGTSAPVPFSDVDVTPKTASPSP